MVDAPLAEIVRLRQAISALDPAAPPTARVVAGRIPDGARRIGVLPGSFNPPTDAHFALVEAALDRGAIDAGLFLLSVRTVNKEQITGLCLEDRLIALARAIGDRPNLAAVLTNRGLYVDQAAALRADLAPPPAEIVFLVGFDKILQIFDPKYYDDRDAALRRLFADARILVAPRGGQNEHDLADLLAQPENQPFARSVAPLPLAPDSLDPDLSATRVRADLAAGLSPRDVPPPIAEFLAAIGAFSPDEPGPDGAPINRYAARLAAVDRLAPVAGTPAGEAAFAKDGRSGDAVRPPQQ